MLWTMLFLIPWFLGLLAGHSLGGFIHILLVIAIIALLIHIEADCSDYGPDRGRKRYLKRQLVLQSGKILPKPRY